jgi:hypothetical protein
MNTINEGEIHLETQVSEHTFFLKSVAHTINSAMYKICCNIFVCSPNKIITFLNYFTVQTVMKCWGEFHFGLYQATNVYCK